MIAFPGLLAGPAEEAGMKVPEDPEDFDPKEFPHFSVFLKVQLGAPMPGPTAHWENAKVVASVPDDLIRLVTFKDLLDGGLSIGLS